MKHNLESGVWNVVDFKKVRSLAVFIFPDVEGLDFVGVYEVLGNANAMVREGL